MPIRMMLSILPEAESSGALRPWAQQLRDRHAGWMAVAQQGVQSFVVHAMAQQVPFAMETVFSYLKVEHGRTVSKVDLITQMQAAGYFVLLIFVGLANVQLSILRVQTRVAQNGHDVPVNKLNERFPRTQQAISLALSVADAALLVDNSRSEKEAFTPCRVQVGKAEIFDIRVNGSVPTTVAEWLNKVSSRG